VENRLPAGARVGDINIGNRIVSDDSGNYDAAIQAAEKSIL
jgi:hypothetical protein